MKNGPRLALPTVQQAVHITAPGGPEVLQLREAPVPLPTDDELLVQVHSAGVNSHDCGQRRRGPTPLHSDIPGLEVSGSIVAMGRGVRGWQVGQSVCALTDGGGYAHYVVCKAALALPVPDGQPLAAMAALPEALFTVWHNFYAVAGLGPGESVLLHGGASGVGTLAIQLLSQFGHPVYATCSSPDKQQACLQLGARAVFDYRHDDFAAGVRAQTEGRGVDVILDLSGGAHSVRNLDALARRGRLVHLSPGQDARFDVPLRALMAKEARVTGTLLRPLPLEEKMLLAQCIRERVWPKVLRGDIVPVLHRRHALHAAAAAHHEMEQGRHIGKIVLTVEPGG